MARTTQVEKPLDEATKYVVLLQVCACTHAPRRLSCSLCWILGFFFFAVDSFFFGGSILREAALWQPTMH
jgi:hypothetical protein